MRAKERSERKVGADDQQSDQWPGQGIPVHTTAHSPKKRPHFLTKEQNGKNCLHVTTRDVDSGCPSPWALTLQRIITPSSPTFFINQQHFQPWELSTSSLAAPSPPTRYLWLPACRSYAFQPTYNGTASTREQGLSSDNSRRSRSDDQRQGTHS